MATLELYLIRHGVAAERGEEFPDDSKRPLTSEGIARLRKEAKALEGLGVSFEQGIAVEPDSFERDRPPMFLRRSSKGSHRLPTVTR